MHPSIPKSWLARLLASARRPATGQGEPAGDHHGEAESQPAACEVEVHALDASGYGLFRHRGYWLVSWAGAWFQATSLEARYTAVDPRMVPIALVAMVAETRTRAPRCDAGQPALQTACLSSDN